jgi:hypothetical protein
MSDGKSVLNCYQKETAVNRCYEFQISESICFNRFRFCKGNKRFADLREHPLRPGTCTKGVIGCRNTRLMFDNSSSLLSGGSSWCTVPLRAVNIQSKKRMHAGYGGQGGSPALGDPRPNLSPLGVAAILF